MYRCSRAPGILKPHSRYYAWLETARPPLPSQGSRHCILGPNPAEAAGLLPGHSGSGEGAVGCPSYILPWLLDSCLHQAELERERAQLLVRATMAEQQLSELQEYVDQHLGR